jgi:hypothetical protein
MASFKEKYTKVIQTARKRGIKRATVNPTDQDTSGRNEILVDVYSNMGTHMGHLPIIPQEIVPESGVTQTMGSSGPNKGDVQFQKLLDMLAGHGDSNWTQAEVKLLKQNYPNPFEQLIMELKSKSTGNRNFTMLELKFIHNNRGSIFQTLLDKWYDRHVASYSSIPQHDREFSDTSMTDDVRFCGIIHAGLVKQEQCVMRLNFGPQQWHDMHHEDFKTVSMLMFRRKWLLNLPMELSAINTGTLANLSYTTGLNTRIKITVSQDSFHAALLTRLKKAGFNNTTPVFCEFFLSSVCDSQTSFEDHAFGFVRVLKSLQKQYKGPIVLVFTPVSYTPGLDWNTYNAKKMEWAKHATLLRTMGQFCNVPVLCLRIQTCNEDGEMWVTRNRFWNNEPLFTKQGEVTCEYFARVKEMLIGASKSMQLLTLYS